MSSIRVLTGAAGFIGSHLADALLARGDVVIGIDDLSLGTRRNVAAASTNPRFMLHECDLNDLPRASAAVATARSATLRPGVGFEKNRHGPAVEPG